MRKIDSNLEACEQAGMVRGAIVAMALMAASTALGGCISDPDCGVCDPENLILETVNAANYAGKDVFLFAGAGKDSEVECVGDGCRDPLERAKVFVNEVKPCEETDEALNEDDASNRSLRGTKEWCKLSPLLVGDGVNFIFNNLLDPTSIELVRKQLTNPQLFEVYDWKTRVVKITGPISRYNGDFFKGSGENPDLITRSVNLSCIENLRGLGLNFGHAELEGGACDKMENIGGEFWPLRTEFDEEIKARKGATDWRGNSCDTPDDGPDTCCSACDYDLAVNVAKYGLVSADATDPGAWRTDADPAGACDPMGDKYVECRNFLPYVARSEEDPGRYSFAWGGQGVIDSAIPIQDKLRETHPDDRPPGVEQKTVPCQSKSDCTTGAKLPGTECVGRFEDSGLACSQDSDQEACIDRRCVAEWFVSCETVDGVGGRCVDQRFDDKAAMSCFGGSKGRLANSDADENGEISPEEGCSGGGGCDPYFPAPGTRKVVDHYDRKSTLPETTRDCICLPDTAMDGDTECPKVDDPDQNKDRDGDGIPCYCEETVRALCYDGGDFRDDRRNEFATRFVTATGGVIYDPAIKGVAFRPADLGSVGRAFTEGCAEGRGLVGRFNIKDGWRANDSFSESDENFDRAMCSSSKYEIEFEVPGGDGQYIRDKVGNTLEGRKVYRFETPDFHVVPGSGFPTSNLRIGACDDFELRFSNKYDMSAANLRKIQIVEIPMADAPDQPYPVVAGGPDCTTDPEVMGKPPCLTVNVRNQIIGGVNVSIDPKDFGQRLETGKWYRMVIPGLRDGNGNYYSSMEDFRAAYAADPGGSEARYKDAFWDACGMPLILGGAKRPDYFYDFQIDVPKAKEDKDGVLGVAVKGTDGANMCVRLGDSVQFSCDNAPNHFNPEQTDSDLDGFGDVYDLCPTVVTTINTADSDRDGIGNECDTCVKQASTYNKDAVMAGVPTYMLVRANPNQGDWDKDGVGDACDNCIKTPNCGNFGDSGGLDPFVVGKVAPVDNTNVCQTDIDGLKMIGDACVQGGVPDTYPDAAGPIGFGDDDDFDGDGIRNAVDFCPRSPIERVTCGGDAECGGNKCTEGVCNHSDVDGDQVGDTCDTCPFDSNPSQIADGGMQEDDEDGDFVGRACETNPDCLKRPDPRPFAFYDVSANGWCCTVQLDEIAKERVPHDIPEISIDEEGMCLITRKERPLKIDCPDNDPTCRRIPDAAIARPGLVSLPAGCEQALLDAGKAPGELATRLSLVDFGGDAGALWGNLCFLPQLDQDFDGIGDTCDLCPFAFDPNNEPYINENGRLFPDSGRFCNGSYDVEKLSACYVTAQPACYEAEGGTTGGDTTGGTTGG